MYRRPALVGRLAVALLCVALLSTPAAAGTVTDAGRELSQQGTATTPTGDDTGGPLGVVTGALGTVGSFLFGTTVGNALVGVPLGLYLGLKTIALYLEYYD